MGKKRNVVMDQSQEEQLNIRSSNNKYGSAYDLPEEFAMLAALEGGSKQTTESTQETEASSKKTKERKRKIRSKKFVALKKLINRQKKYSIHEAIENVLITAKENFDSTIELNIQTKKENINGTAKLPHGTGKEKKVVVFNAEILSKIENKKIDFDILIAKPEDMAQLTKHAKFLGPKGLMPNPKNGTIATDTEKAAKQFGGNSISYKTEKKAPLIHMVIGKKSFGQTKLEENLKSIISSITTQQIRSASISSSMGPGIKISLDSIN